MNDVSESFITPPKLIDAAEVARLLSISKATVWRLRDANKLPPAIALTNQCVRWERDALLSWVKNQSCTAVNASNLRTGEAR